jgi:hypothetical protein
MIDWIKRWAGIALYLTLAICEAIRHPVRFAENEETGSSGGRHY